MSGGRRMWLFWASQCLVIVLLSAGQALAHIRKEKPSASSVGSSILSLEQITYWR